MATDKQSKLHHLDLSRRRQNFEAIFDSVINKIPDLCMPPALRLANEDDYFNKTASIKLLPFRRQREFETSISPELEEARSYTPTTSIQCPSPVIGRRCISPRAEGPSELAHRSFGSTTRADILESMSDHEDHVTFKKQLKVVSFGVDTQSTAAIKATTVTNDVISKILADSTRQKDKLFLETDNFNRKAIVGGQRGVKLIPSKEQVAIREKFERRHRLHERYSKFKLVSGEPKRSNVDSNNNNNKSTMSDKSKLLDDQLKGLNNGQEIPLRNNHNENRIQNLNKHKRGKNDRDSAYPYANPMPECMLSDDNIDNLRDIIVSSGGSIEWKMLTPVRPTNDYEEMFFDKLITLHRLRYEARAESNAHLSKQLPAFRHTRHPSSMRVDSRLYDYNLKVRPKSGTNREIATNNNDNNGADIRGKSSKLKICADLTSNDRGNGNGKGSCRKGSKGNGNSPARRQSRVLPSLSMGIKVRSKLNAKRNLFDSNSRRSSYADSNNRRNSTFHHIVPTLTLTPYETITSEPLEVTTTNEIKENSGDISPVSGSLLVGNPVGLEGTHKNDGSSGHKSGTTTTTTMKDGKSDQDGAPKLLPSTRDNNTDFELSFQDDFSYEIFSRFSKRNANKDIHGKKNSRPVGKPKLNRSQEEFSLPLVNVTGHYNGDHELGNKDGSANNNNNNHNNNTGAGDANENDDDDDDQMDDIISHLMSSTQL